MSPRQRFAALLAMGVLLTAVGCARPPDGNGRAATVACAERAGPLEGGTRAAELAGTYELTLVATRGDSTGSRAEGRLTLQPNDSAHAVVRGMGSDTPRPNVSTPLFGWTDLPAGQVDAVNTGSLGATDPDAPGVLVIESIAEETGTPRDIILRLGAFSNDRGRLLFDGGYTVLRVSWIDDGAFGGSWESAAMNYGSAGGYFCARPAAP